MLYRVFGRAGSGKTEYLINCLKEKQSAGVDCLFLVPEQQSVDMEMRLEKAGAVHLNTEVLNFERLPNHIFRHIGLLAAESVDKVGKCVLIRRAIEELGDALTLYKEPGGVTLSELADTLSALKRLGVSPAALEELGDKPDLGADDILKAKIKESAKIYARYAALCGEEKRDDSDSLTRLTEALKGSDYFVGKTVFIDGIYTYTPLQYKLIGRMAECGADIYISFTADEDDSGMFTGTLNCARKVKALCAGKAQDVFMPENCRTNDSALRFLEGSLWQGATYPERADSISLAVCADRYEESLWAAARVYDLRKRGLRFEQIAIACRHPENYVGTLDTVFAKYGIPFYLAEKDSAATKPLAAFIMGLLEMASDNCPTAAVKKYLKTTFSVLDDGVDELIHYSESWGIKGKSWLAEVDWLMNPTGYTEQTTPREEKQLARINAARGLLAQSISPVIEALRAKDLTVGRGVKALYGHLCDCGVQKKLSHAAKRLIDLGDSDGGAKTAALWGVTVDIFDKLYSLAGDMPVSARKLKELLVALLQNSTVGAIPSYTDAVSIGDARLMRADGVKAMIILGVNEGEFPSLPKKSGIFSNKESALLEARGIELLPGIEKAVEEERFFFYICCSAPSDYLAVSYIGGDGGRPSPAFSGLATMFPHNEIRAFGADERDYMFCPAAAKDAMPYLKNKALKTALAQKLYNLGYGDFMAAVPPLQDREAYIKARQTPTITLSYSRIDCYNGCGFKYFLRYILNLRDDRSISFSGANTGTYMHKVMEEYMKKRMEGGTFVPADREETVAEVESITADYIKAVIKNTPQKRFYKQMERLKAVAVYVCQSVCEEFCHSRFVPEGFEVAIGDGGIVPPRLISPGGRSVKTRGFIDRLDSTVIDGKKYLRVVDYKSSEKTISLAKAEKGENIQMLSYLFTCCEGTDNRPAGVLYRTFGHKESQTGIVADDPNISYAMDDSGKSIKKAKPTTPEEMEQYKTLVYDHIKDTADRICDGNVCVAPFKKDKTDCAFCPYGEVCRAMIKTKF